MKKAILIFLIITLTFSFAACGGGWVEFDYNNPEAKFKAEQMLEVEDDDLFADFFECRVWAHKRTLGIVLPTTKQEYFEGYIARPDLIDNIYIFLYDVKGDYKKGDYTECKIIDFNEKRFDEFVEADNCIGHYKIEKVQIRKQGVG